MSERPSGAILDIQRFSIHDGPGIRTTVFLKGCPLRCVWCHNPEGISPDPQLSFIASRCVGCGTCLRSCAEGVHLIHQGQRILDRGRCRACGECARQCPTGALELVGRKATVGEVLEVVLRDQPFYRNSGGGVTLSGGEPLHQPEFSLALLAAAKEHGLDTAVETNGYASWECIERLAPLVDLFLYDVKETDPERHRQYTGVALGPIVDNLRRLSAAGSRIRLRCPIVPGQNDREDHFAALAALARELPGIEGVDVMPYHRLGEGKLERLGMAAEGRARTAPPDSAAVESWRRKVGAVRDH